MDNSRSREGARIEMAIKGYKLIIISVAPARERGLKSHYYQPKGTVYVAGRSREGARIEIPLHLIANSKPCVAPARERGLKLGLQNLT